MNKLFNRDTVFMQVIEKVTNFCIINVLTLICSFPVITLGAAVTAGHTAMQTMLTDCETPVFKTYFQSFSGNFKQSTGLWLIALFVIAFLLADFTLVYMHFQTEYAIAMYVVLGVISFLVLGTAAYAFPLVARYENTLKGHLDTALYLALRGLPRTLVMVVIYLCPALIALFSLEVFVRTMTLWVFIGIGSILYLQTRLLMPVFRKLEQDNVQQEA